MKRPDKILWLACLLCGAYAGKAETPAVALREEMLRLPTYPFSDPDAVPHPERNYYPYFRYDGYAERSEPRDWRAVTLENEQITVTLLPEIGGKVWGARDKRTGKDFIYHNHVVKFRDVALRGPWSAGGIEFNFGITGHAPTVSTPVDWCVRTNADGSASCFVAATEHINRTSWQVEVRLFPGADHFITRTTWFNAANLPGPCYNWMNAAYSVRGNPEFFFPAEAYVGHGGDAHAWPRDAKGRDLSIYANNAFGKSKSYHLVNGDNRIYAIWWPEAGVGSYHANAIYDKFGRKIWLWALSREGGIWEDLLTDSDGQYAELQSGRFFSQPRAETVRTPFKYPTFDPGAVQTYDEKWGVLRSLDELKAQSRPEDHVKRPLESPADFNWDSAYGLYLQGQQGLRSRDDRGGETNLLACLAKEPHFIPALDALAGLEIRRGRYREARELAARALAVNTYDPEANYLDGFAALARDEQATAKERLGMAATSPLYRAPALALIAKARLKDGHWPEARAAAERCLRMDPMNPDAHLARVAALRCAGDVKRAVASARLLLVQWPLHPGARWELTRLGVNGIDFAGEMRNELPAETILDLAGWYEEAGLWEDALALFKFIPRHPVARIRAAHRFYLLKRGEEARKELDAVAELLTGNVYPFRRESRAALLWAAAQNASWKCRYWAAVFLASTGEDAGADEWLEKCGEANDAVFRLFRAARRTGAARWADLIAAKSASDGWRVGRDMARHLEEVKDFEGMLAVTRDYIVRYPDAMPLRLLHARALLGTKDHAGCVAWLEKTVLLPSEFGKNGHLVWKRACAGLARDALARQDVKAADEALRKYNLWPENLGIGKPYPKEK